MHPCLLMLKHWPERQASNLMHTSRSLLKYSLGTETGGCSSCSPFAVLQDTSISQRDVSCAGAQGLPLDHLALEASGTCVPSPTRLYESVSLRPLSVTQIVTAVRGHLYIMWLWVACGVSS